MPPFSDRQYNWTSKVLPAAGEPAEIGILFQRAFLRPWVENRITCFELCEENFLFGETLLHPAHELP